MYCCHKIFPKAIDVLGHAVLYALHCKKTRPSTQVMQKGHGTGRTRNLCRKNSQTPTRVKEARTAEDHMEEKRQRRQQLKNSNLIWILFGKSSGKSISNGHTSTVNELLLHFRHCVLELLTKAEIHNLMKRASVELSHQKKFWLKSTSDVEMHQNPWSETRVPFRAALQSYHRTGHGVHMTAWS